MNRYMLKELSLKKLEYGSGAAACKYDGSTRYVRITDIDNEGNLGDDIVSPNSVEEKYVLHDGDILFARTGATVGKTYLYRINDGRCIYAGFLIRLVPNISIIRPEYLYYYTKSPTYKRFVQNSMKVVAQPNINAKQYGELELNVPTLKVQDEIILKLGLVNSIIILRKRELQKLDQLIKARFVEMFGDSYGNPKGWRRVTFKEAGERLSDGPFGSNLKSEHYTDNGVRVIRLGNIGAGRFIDGDKSFISVEHYERLKKYTCKAGEIVIGTLGDPNLRACIVPEEVGFAINKADCVHFIPKGEILNNTFVCQYINCPETLLLAEGMIHGQTRSRISSGQIAQMPIFVPPMRLQNEYAEFVNQVDKSKATVRESLDETQKLFDSLMQQYFG